MHEECKTLGNMKFDFIDKGEAISYCIKLASTMQNFEKPEDIPHLIRQSYVADEFDKARVQEFAKLLAQPENTQIYLRSQSFDDKQLDKYQKWYKYNYSSEKYSEDLLSAFKNPVVADNGKKLDLPPLNTLLPTSFEILPENSNLSEQPVLLETSDDHEVWFMKDDKFKRPKGIVNLKFYTNDCETHKSPEGRVFFEVWDICLKEFRREFCYMADLADLSFSHQMAPGSVNFTWSGYNTSLPNFVKECIKILNAFKSADFVDIFNDKKE